MSQGESRIVIGTAGHVDHGKTTLIRALTGKDADRLKEEKSRGMTIDLGFVPYVMPNGRRVGIVDVPGHERFLKNMLAGATGVDVALFVIAADEGIMPQTREHLEILELLETRSGAVALTKTDMVDPDWLDLVEEDIRSALESTFLKNAEIIRVSAVDGSGVREVSEALMRLADEVEERNSNGYFRIPVDRVFTITGFGTVVTGTLISGTIRVGDAVQVLPNGRDSRLRRIEVHGSKEEEAYAGTRVAVNLAGLELSDLSRGDMLVTPGYLTASSRVDALVKILPGAPRPLKNRTRIRFHIGTAELIGRVTVLGQDEIPPGDEGYIQFQSEHPLVAARGDKFVVRSYSPAQTIGGGMVLDPSPARHRRKDARLMEDLDRRRKGGPSDLLEAVLLAETRPIILKDAAKRLGLPLYDVISAADELESKGALIRLDGDAVAHKAMYATIANRVRNVIEDYHSANPLRVGMPREEVRAAAAAQLDQKAFSLVAAEMARQGVIVAEEGSIRLPEHVIQLSQAEEDAAKTIEDAYLKLGFNPPTPEESFEPAGSLGKRMFEYLVETGVLIKISEGLFLHHEDINRARILLRECAIDGRITVSGFRDVTGSSRKVVVPLLEYFDEQRVTRRVGNERILLDSNPS